MKIICTVSEFASLVRGCQTYRQRNASGCIACPLYEMCDDGLIEQHIEAENVIKEEGDGECPNT